MSRPIDADALKEKINTAFLSEIGKLIDNAPTIDAVSEWIPCSERIASITRSTQTIICMADVCSAVKMIFIQERPMTISTAETEKERASDD